MRRSLDPARHHTPAMNIPGKLPAKIARAEFVLWLAALAAGWFVLPLAGAEPDAAPRSQPAQPKDQPETAGKPAAFTGAKSGVEREVAGLKLCWCPPGRFLMGSPRR